MDADPGHSFAGQSPAFSLPFHFVTYSSRTFEDQPSSRNLEHFKAIQAIQQLIGPRPIVFDREFSYQGLLRSLMDAAVPFVIRLNLGANQQGFYYDAEQKHPLRLWLLRSTSPKSTSRCITREKCA